MLTPVEWGGNVSQPPSVFRRYTITNLERGLGEIMPGAVRNDPLYIVCSGPSLSETWTELIDRPGEIWGLNAAYDWLCQKGIRPDYGVCIACEDPILRFFQEVGKGDKFLFASQTHPKLVDRVLERGGHVKFWHTAHPPEWEIPTPKGQQIFGGGTVGSRSFDLAWVLGYRNVHVLGMDACLSPDGRVAVETPMFDDSKHLLRTFYIGGRAFVAFPSHAHQVEDIGAILRPLEGMQVTFYGDGLMQWAMQSGLTPEVL